jgi:hypothetical protein
MKFRNKKNFRHGIPAYTGTFRALVLLQSVWELEATAIIGHSLGHTELISGDVLLLQMWPMSTDTTVVHYSVNDRKLTVFLDDEISQCSATLFLPTARPTVTMARQGTLQNFALLKVVQNNTWAQKMLILYVNRYVILIKVN